MSVVGYNTMKHLIISILAILFLCSSLKAQNYIVSSSGLDDFNTIQKAVDTAEAGDTVYIKAGTYAERVFFFKSGTATNPIVFKNFEQDKVIVNGIDINWTVNWGGLFDISEVSHIHISGIEIINSKHAGIFLDNAEHISIDNCKTHNTYSSGIGVWYAKHISITNNEVSLACNDGGEECITISDSSDVKVNHNEVHHNGPGTNGGEGIDVKGGSHDVTVSYNHVHHLRKRTGVYADAWNKHTYNIKFDSNRVHDCENVGLAVASERGGLIENITFVNNIVYNNLDGGMAVGGWTEGTPVTSNPVEHINIINNTFYHNYNDGIYIINKDAKDIKVYNNIVSQNILPNGTAHQIYVEHTPLAEVDIRSNLIDGLSGQYGQINEILATPLFRDAAQADFRLQPSSLAINNGIQSNHSLLDYVKNSRNHDGIWDIGAYEYRVDMAFLIPILYLFM